MIDLKEKLLTTGIVIDNEYLHKYCELVIDNRDTSYVIHKTQSHHIIPRYYCKENSPHLIKDNSNKVNLLYKDHILAHYYLSLCSSNGKYKAKNVCALFKMLNVPQTEFPGSPKEFICNLDGYEELYEMYAKHQGDHLRGKSQSSEHIAKRVHKNTGQKRTEETRKKMGEWQRGKPKSESARENMRKAQKKYMESESVEHRYSRIAKGVATRANWSEERKAEYSRHLSEGIKGRNVPEHERINKSIAMSGKPKSLDHRISLSRAKSKYRYSIHNQIFESTMEARLYLQSIIDEDLPNHKWNTILNRQGEIGDVVINREKKS